MDEKFDRTKVVDCMFDPITSLILAELEDGEKQCSFLAQQADISESEVLERLSYLIEYEFVLKNSEKLSTILEDSSNFDDAISGLEKLDTYLN